MPIENERGVQTNWNVPVSVPTFSALPQAAPVGVIIRAEDTGISWQWTGTTWIILVPGSPVAPVPTTLQGSIIVDPANTTGVATATGLNSATIQFGDGTSLTGPVFSTWANLVGAWKTCSPTFSQSTTIGFTGPNAVTDPIYFYPQSTNAVSVTLRAVMTLVTTIALAATVAKSRAAGANSLLQSNLGAGRVTEQFLVNTTRGNSCAFVETVVAGNVWNISQPFAPVVAGNWASPAEVDTWANGDNVQVFSFTTLSVSAFVPALTANSFNGVTNTSAFYRCTWAAPVFNTLAQIGGISTAESINTGLFVLLFSQTTNRFVNHFFDRGCLASYADLSIVGGVIGTSAILTLAGSPNNQIDGDIIIRGTLESYGNTQLGIVYLGNGGESISVFSGRISGQNIGYGGPVFYGNAGSFIRLRGTSMLSITGTFAAAFTAPFLIATGIILNAASTASNNDGANPSVIRGGIATTVANLDAALPGGFAGFAFNIGGASIRNSVF